MAVEDFAYQQIGFEGLTCDFAWDGERTMLRDIRLRHRSGQLHADLFDAPDDFRLNIDSSIVPSAFGPLAPTGLRPFLREWEWQRSPNIHLSNPRDEPRSRLLAWRRHPGARPQRFRGVWMNSGSANLRFGDGLFALENFHVTRDEGSGTGCLGLRRRNGTNFA